MAEVPTITEDDGRVIYDLDAYRAARREHEGTQFFRLKGVDLPLPSANDVPIDLPDLVRDGLVTKAIEGLFGEHAQQVLDLHLSMEEFRVIVSLIMGVPDGLGESTASTP
jgi:hypothetical protein